MNFQESTTILNASTKKSGNLLNASRISKHNKLFISLMYPFDKSCLLQLIKQQLHGHLSPISQSIQVRRAKHAGTAEELTSNKRRSIPEYKHISGSWPAKIYIYQLSANTAWCLGDLTKTIADKDVCREGFKGIHTVYQLWWWWWWYMSVGCSFFFSTCMSVWKKPYQLERT